MVTSLVEVLQKNMLLSQITYRAEILESVSLHLNHRGVILLDDSFETILMDENAKRLLSSLRHKEKQTPRELPGSCIPEEIYYHCERLKQSDMEREPVCRHRFFLEVDQAGDHLSVLVRSIKRRNRPLVFLVCLEGADPLEPIKQKLNESELTRREREVAFLICKGLKNNQISDRLCISAHTVENHLRSIYWKLGVCNRTSLIHKVMALS
jgi:DNA-binding CsgD family transcriptional regulator